MSPPHRVVAAAVALLALAAIGLLWLRGGDSVGIVPPTPSPPGSTTPAASPSASSAPDATPDRDTLATLREIEEQVREIRGLPAPEIGLPEIITRAQLAGELERLFAENYPEAKRERDNVTQRALGLLEEGQDVAALQLELQSAQVLGFYDDDERRMVIVSDAGLDAAAKLTYAHEYTHALQDAAFGLDSLETDAEGEDDRHLARVALVEGDALVVMWTWAFQHLSREEQLEAGDQDLPDTSGSPSWLTDTLLFPYGAGLEWVLPQVGDLTRPDFSAIDQAYADPPDSTEQILDLEKWRGREAPIAVEGPELAAQLGDDWTEVESTPLGEATIAINLEYLGLPAEVADAAAEGWGGDRLVVAEGPDDAFALAWILAWDSPSDADEFRAAYEQALNELPFPARVVELDSGHILVTHASDDGVLQRTLDAAGGI